MPCGKLEPRQQIDNLGVGRPQPAQVAIDLHREIDRPAGEKSSVRRPMSFVPPLGLSLRNRRERRKEPMTAVDNRTRWLALYTLSIGSLMIVLDMTVVNVALPSIKEDLGFSDSSLAWVVNACLLTYGGFRLLGGRLGDLYGHRRLFLAGITLFTLASLVCGVSTTQGMLIAARTVQGLGGAVASAVSLSLMMTLFTEQGERAKAMGVFGFVASGGGSIGVLLGGILTDLISWPWIFLVNFPIGILVVILTLRLIPGERTPAMSGRLDIAGAVTVTAALMLAVYAI